MKRGKGRPAMLLAGTALALVGALLAAAGPAGATSGRAARSRFGSAVKPVVTQAVRPDTPAGFWYGTDSWPLTLSSQRPYHEPVIGGYYGGYIGMAGNWAHWLGCGGRLAWSATNASQANTNFTTYHLGIGTAVYWFMGGPGVDPRYNGTATEGYAWGRAQAQRAIWDIGFDHVKYPVVFMDIELPGIAPAPDNGWNSVYTSPCSGQVRTYYIAAQVDRADFNGFWDYMRYHTSFIPGVYSSPSVWASIFGTGSASYIAHTDEWTYTDDTASLANSPSGWCLPYTSTCAQFFGGVTASDPQALMWQWSGGGGTSNGYGDFDQIDANRQR
jgi:hypothetical protein